MMYARYKHGPQVARVAHKWYKQGPQAANLLTKTDKDMTNTWTKTKRDTKTRMLENSFNVCVV